MKTLYLLRHAKAESGGKSQPDEARALTGRGREASAAMGAYLRARAYAPALVLLSPATRALETWTRVSEAAQFAPERREARRLYLATAGEILAEIHRLSDSLPSAAVVGHNPGLHHLALLLAPPERTSNRIALELKFPTGALCVFVFTTDRWRSLAPGKGELRDFKTPAEV